jgi:hypothetical protein
MTMGDDVVGHPEISYCSCAELLPDRRLRAAARVVKRKMSSYRVKVPAHRSWPQPQRSIAEATSILAPP